MAPYFEALLDTYQVKKGGEYLWELWGEDWALFADKKNSKEIVEKVLGDLAKPTYLPRDSSSAPTSDSWTRLRQELQLENRFFPTNAPDHALFRVLMENLARTGIATPLYRARLMTDGKAYRASDMGAPPIAFASDGRANPSGIAYLYLADGAETAIAEVKPSKGALVAVAEFQPTHGGYRLIDLTDPRGRISPFRISNIADVRASMSFLQSLGEELSIPTQPHRASRDYLATQYLSELIKVSGYDGIIYKSSVGLGRNLTFFNPTACVPIGDVSVYEVENVTVIARRT